MPLGVAVQDHAPRAGSGRRDPTCRRAPPRSHLVLATAWDPALRSRARAAARWPAASSAGGAVSVACSTPCTPPPGQLLGRQAGDPDAAMPSSPSAKTHQSSWPRQSARSGTATRGGRLGQPLQLGEAGQGEGARGRASGSAVPGRRPPARGPTSSAATRRAGAGRWRRAHRRAWGAARRRRWAAPARRQAPVPAPRPDLQAQAHVGSRARDAVADPARGPLLVAPGALALQAGGAAVLPSTAALASTSTEAQVPAASSPSQRGGVASGSTGPYADAGGRSSRRARALVTSAPPMSTPQAAGEARGRP